MAMDKTKINLSEPIRRSFLVPDIRAEEGTGIVEGHAAVFDQKVDIGGWFFEVIERGAFDGCDFDDVLMCVNHDIRKVPLARSRRNNGNSTMQISVDDKGLLTKATLDLEKNYDAKAVHSSIARGDMTGMSFMFIVSAQSWTELDTDMPTRHITKIKRVLELGPVNFPAYPGTDISARDQQTLDNARRELDNARSQQLDSRKGSWNPYIRVTGK